MTVVIVLVHFSTEKGGNSIAIRTHLLKPFVFEMPLFESQTNTFYKEWKIIRIVLGKTKVLMNQSIFETPTQATGNLKKFQFPL